MVLTLATFNLENLGIREDESSPEVRARLPLHLEALRSTVERIGADAVAFQELLDPTLLGPLLSGLGYPHVVVGERGSSPLVSGVFSRFPLRNPKTVATGTAFSLLDRKTGMEIGIRGPFSRPSLEVTWDVPGFPVTLLVVHWKSKIPSFTPARAERPVDPWESLGDAGEGRLVTEVRRLAQAVQLRKAVDRHLEADPRSRLVVLGDFNDTLESEGLRILCGDARSCDSPGLVAGELLPCEAAVPPDQRYTQIYRGRKEMLDHILMSRGLLTHFLDARVFNEYLLDAEDVTGLKIYSADSDHAPFAARFRIPDGEAARRTS